MTHNPIRAASVWLLLASCALLATTPAAYANDNPFVGKEWLIRFSVDSPRLHFPAATYQTKPLLVVEHYQHRWYKIRFTYGNTAFDGNPPEHLRGK